MVFQCAFDRAATSVAIAQDSPSSRSRKEVYGLSQDIDKDTI